MSNYENIIPWLFLLLSIMHTNTVQSQSNNSSLKAQEMTDSRRWLTETVAFFWLCGLVKKNTNVLFVFFRQVVLLLVLAIFFKHCTARTRAGEEDTTNHASLSLAWRDSKTAKMKEILEGKIEAVCAKHVKVSQWFQLNWFAVHLHIFKKLRHVFHHIRFLYGNGGFYP